MDVLDFNELGHTKLVFTMYCVKYQNLDSRLLQLYSRDSDFPKGILEPVVKSVDSESLSMGGIRYH